MSPESLSTFLYLFEKFVHKRNLGKWFPTWWMGWWVDS